MSLAPLAVLLEFNFTLYQLPILARPIINAAALLACDLYQLILGHSSALYRSGVRESITQWCPRHEDTIGNTLPAIA